MTEYNHNSEKPEETVGEYKRWKPKKTKLTKKDDGYKPWKPENTEFIAKSDLIPRERLPEDIAAGNKVGWGKVRQAFALGAGALISAGAAAWFFTQSPEDNSPPYIKKDTSTISETVERGGASGLGLLFSLSSIGLALGAAVKGENAHRHFRGDYDGSYRKIWTKYEP